MQTRFNLIAAAILAIAGLCSNIGSHHITSIFFYVIGTIFVLAAFLSKDKKDKQIEEIHSEITNNSQNKPTETSTSIIESYMVTAYKIAIESYTTNTVALGRELASKGLASSGAAIVKNKDLKLSHVHNFVNVCLEYANSTKSNYILDKSSVKSLLTDYQKTDISDITTIITNQYIARGIPLNQSVLSSAITNIENTYSVAHLKIDAM